MRPQIGQDIVIGGGIPASRGKIGLPEDRVALAKSYWDRDDMAKCQQMIDEANRYAI